MEFEHKDTNTGTYTQKTLLNYKVRLTCTKAGTALDITASV